MPSQSKLKLNRTFDSQRNLVNGTIIPTVMKALDLELYPVSESIVYDMIHHRHKHQREEYLRNQQSATVKDEQSRRKHLNSRRNDVSNEHSPFY